MIFTALKSCQRVKIMIETDPNNNLTIKETLITIDPSINMKEEIFDISGERLRVLVASADTI